MIIERIALSGPSVDSRECPGVRRAGNSISMKRTILVLFLGYFAIGGAAIEYKGGWPWLYRKLSANRGRVQDTRESIFQILPIGPDDTVLIGDSIVALGEWGELMHDPHYKNRAISGSSTSDVLARLGPIMASKPRRIIVCAGINDIQGGIDPAIIARNREMIMTSVLVESPKTQVIFVPLLPVNQRLYSQWILPDHPGIHMPTPDKCKNSELINLFSLPCSSLLEDGQISSRYTNDGLHLNGEGLTELARIIKLSTYDNAPAA